MKTWEWATGFRAVTMIWPFKFEHNEMLASLYSWACTSCEKPTNSA
jgi:hypothetical protein